MQQAALDVKGQVADSQRQALGHRRRVMEARFGQQRGKFLAPVAPDHIHFAQRRRAHFGYRAQHLITGGKGVFTAGNDDRISAVVAQIGGFGFPPEYRDWARDQGAAKVRGDIDPVVPQNGLNGVPGLKGTPDVARQEAHSQLGAAAKVRVPTLIIDAEFEVIKGPDALPTVPTRTPREAAEAANFMRRLKMGGYLPHNANRLKIEVYQEFLANMTPKEAKRHKPIDMTLWMAMREAEAKEPTRYLISKYSNWIALPFTMAIMWGGFALYDAYREHRSQAEFRAHVDPDAIFFPPVPARY